LSGSSLAPAALQLAEASAPRLRVCLAFQPFLILLKRDNTIPVGGPIQWGHSKQVRIYGDLSDAVPFADAFEDWLSLIWSECCEVALRAYTGGAGRAGQGENPA
jgi:hypothetical protein